MRLLGVTHLPYQDLLIINNHPVLLTQKVSGSPVLGIWEKTKAFNNMDPFHTGLLIISAMLINPEDGKEDNFILSSDQRFLIPIDNDHCFLPSTFQRQGNLWNAFTVNTALQTKTLLFCLDEMHKRIPTEVREHILSLNFDQLFTKWMTELDKLENKFNNLGSQEQRSQFLKQGTVMRIPFYTHFIQNLHWKAHKIQDILNANSEITPFDLLTALEPFAARCYQDSFKQAFHLQGRFKAATFELYKKTATDGSRVSILNTQTMMEIINISEKDLQNDIAFQKMGPVDALELLNQLVQERSERAQKEQELLCELDERNQEKNFISLFGNSSVETNLKALWANSKEGLVLKGSKLLTSSKLTELFTHAPDKGIKMRFLSLLGSPVLTQQEIRLLATECPNLEYLNVSGCGKMKQIFTAEREWPLLARLEAKGCVNLEKLVSYSPMKIVRIGTSRKIEIFVEKSTVEIFAVSNQGISFNSSPKRGNFEVVISSQIISNMNFADNILFKQEKMEKYWRNLKITIGKYSIESGKDLAVFVSQISLSHFEVKTQNLQKLSQLKLINLKHLNLSHCAINDEGIQILTQANWPLLKDLDLSYNDAIFDDGLEILSRGNWPLLETLDVTQTKITDEKAIRFLLETNWLNLEKFIFHWRIQISTRILLPKHQPQLAVLDLSESKITQIEIKLIVNKCEWPQLKHINFFHNSQVDDEVLETLSKKDWPLLQTITLTETSVTKKGLLNFIFNTDLPNLQKIELWGDQDFADCLLQQNWSQTEKVDFRRGGFTPNEIKLLVNKSKWPQLKHLNLSSNEITDEGIQILTQANWPFLEILNLKSTGITSIGLEIIVNYAKWPQLKDLNLSFNSAIDDQGLEVFAKGDWLHLQRLDLGGTGITKKGLVNFILKKKWPNLQGLEYDRWKLHAENILQKNWPRLETLDLSDGGITQNDIETIVKMSKWPLLKHLDLSHNEVFDEGILGLVLAEWPLLEHLNLSNTELSPKSLEIIVNQSKWPQLLKHLNLSNNEIFYEGLSAFSFAEWPLLKELHLKSTKITSDGPQILVNRVHLPNLKQLDVSENAIFDKGLEILASGNWPFFEHLIYYNTQVTPEGHVNLLENFKWPNLNRLEHSLNESICWYNHTGNRQDILLAMVPMYYLEEPTMVAVLNKTWLNSREISLSVQEPHEKKIKMVILPRDKLDQFDNIQLSLDASMPLQCVLLPPNLTP